jgi:RpiB/LacA/LacB family sugar-phosphate isomerase
VKVLFVCSGNTCRSPMAAAIWRHLGGEAESRGLHVGLEAPMAGDAVRALKELGVPVGEHRSRGVEAEDLLAADHVLTMTRSQKDELLARFPWARDFVHTLAEAAGTGGDIADPVGQGFEVYRETAETLERLIGRAKARLTPAAPYAFAVGADHAGFPLKVVLVAELERRALSVLDVGTYESESCDYPDFALPAAQAVALGRARQGLLICGTGQGMAITANKVAGVRAAAVSEPVSARLAREHNDANVLCLGARIVGEEVARAVLEAFLAASFAGGRHSRRIEKITRFERGEGA